MKTFTHKDISACWYKGGRLVTSTHDYVDLLRWGHTERIMDVNTDGIYDIVIKDNTISIQAKKDLIIYDLTAKTLGCNIRLDTSITTCQYMKKYAPENAKYYCNESIIDTVGSK